MLSQLNRLNSTEWDDDVNVVLGQETNYEHLPEETEEVPKPLKLGSEPRVKPGIS